MPFHGTQARVHKAVVWLRTGIDKNARPVVSATALEIDCRWDDSVRTMVDSQGNSVAIDATISGYDDAIPIGSAVWRGSVEDIPGTAQTPVLDVMEVISITNTDDIRGRNTYREASLMRQKDVL